MLGEADVYQLSDGDRLVVRFEVPQGYPSSFVGFGLWYRADPGVTVTLVGDGIPTKRTLTPPAAPDWSKCGSMWVSSGEQASAEVIFEADEETTVAIWDAGCGVVGHDHLLAARHALLKNMHRYSPEAHFITVPGPVQTTNGAGGAQAPVDQERVPLKACNRCARFLPINVTNERLHLSFSNHCVAAHRRPCKHATFSRLENVDDGSIVRLEYGFQLECRFCKKFEVNAAHNPMRTAGQMKEDAARRRGFEMLLTELYRGSPQLRYRHETGAELAGVIYRRFEGTCFRCGNHLESPNSMHLDHTRPLALLWPLDDTATALCGSCNSEKRDRPPSEFYTDREIRRLSGVCGLPAEALQDPKPNVEAIRLLVERLDWFFADFLTQPALLKVREGKTAAELLVKALQKVMEAAADPSLPDLEQELERRRTRDH